MLKQAHFSGRVAAIAQFQDQRTRLLEAGADVVFNYYAEVGAGFAAESRRLLEPA